MNVKDHVRIRKTDIAGTVIYQRGDRLVVKLDQYDMTIRLYEDELELMPTVNPCVICGAETPEERQVCGQCERGETQ